MEDHLPKSLNKYHHFDSTYSLSHFFYWIRCFLYRCLHYYTQQFLEFLALGQIQKLSFSFRIQESSLSFLQSQIGLAMIYQFLNYFLKYSCIKENKNINNIYYQSINLKKGYIIYLKMLHKPTTRKVPRKYENSQKEQKEQVKKEGSKPLMRAASNALNKRNERPSSVKGRVAKVEQKLNNVVGKSNNYELQALLIDEIKGIKNQLKQIKQHIGIYGVSKKPEHLTEEGEDQEQNIYNIPQSNRNNGKKQQQYHQTNNHPKTNKKTQAQPIGELPKNFSNVGNYKLYERPKQLIDIGKIQPYMKQFKIQISKSMLPFYHGYHKKSSKPVIIKYCSQNKSMENIFNLYERLWKNIVKSKNICINKVYDLHEPLATYILVIQANKYSLSEMMSNKVASIPQILCSLLRALQFFHQCGYLYRNVHPFHVMWSYENEVVLLDLKNMKKFVDIKGKHISLTRDTDEVQDQFVSNNRARGLREGRKDDLESLGYLALYMLQGALPWGLNNLVQVRSKLTLKQLCGRYPGLLEYMILIAQMQTEDVPSYDKLAQCLAAL